MITGVDKKTKSVSCAFFIEFVTIDGENRMSSVLHDTLFISSRANVSVLFQMCDQKRPSISLQKSPTIFQEGEVIFS